MVFEDIVLLTGCLVVLSCFIAARRVATSDLRPEGARWWEVVR